MVTMLCTDDKFQTEVIDMFDTAEEAIKWYLNIAWEAGEDTVQGESITIVDGRKLMAVLTVMEFDPDCMVGTIEVYRPGVETYSVKVRYVTAGGEYQSTEIEYL